MAFYQCEYCGETFKAIPSDRRRFCSKLCRNRAVKRPRRVLKDRVCCVCGKTFRPRSSTSRFCSQDCARPKLVAEGKHKTYTYDITWDILDGYLKTLPIGVGLPTWAAIHIGCCRGAVQNAIKRLNFPTPGRVRSAGSEKPSHTAYAAVKRTACVVCGETRVIDAAHIVPRSKGGSGDLSNIAPLCPTHHRCFDRGLLTATEQTSLDTYLESRGIPPEREPVCS